MRRRSVYPAVWFAMTVICCDASEARDNALPSDLKPMLEHLAIVSEMMRVGEHVRPDLKSSG
jgi:hypothetical protein